MTREALIEALESARQPCRRLDALATAWAMAPQGWSLDPVEDLDGWNINLGQDELGEARLWMCSADVGYVTGCMDAAMELLEAARPETAAAIAARGLGKLLSQSAGGLEARAFSQRVACRIVAELLRDMGEVDVDTPREIRAA